MNFNKTVKFIHQLSVFISIGFVNYAYVGSVSWVAFTSLLIIEVMAVKIWVGQKGQNSFTK